jgi:hypothetical protein
MAQIGISVTKKTAYRDSVQHFSNIYHYGAAALGNPNEGQAEVLLDIVVAFERSIHGNVVTFADGKVWSSGGTKAENNMLFQKSLSGPGTGPTVGMDKERAFLIMWPAGKNTRGKPVYLRKWYHANGTLASPSAISLRSEVLEQTSGFTNSERNAIAQKVDEITRIGDGLEEWGLVAESGRERDGGLPIAHRYLEHRQLGDEWRS